MNTPDMTIPKTREDAMQWMRAMHDAGLLFHPEDDPYLVGNMIRGEWVPLFTPDVADRVADIMATIWNIADFDPCEYAHELSGIDGPESMEPEITLHDDRNDPVLDEPSGPGFYAEDDGKNFIVRWHPASRIVRVWSAWECGPSDPGHEKHGRPMLLSDVPQAPWDVFRAANRYAEKIGLAQPCGLAAERDA